MVDISPILEIREIAKSFPGVRALKGVGFDVYPGEVLALLGENGAGKSTLMKILAGVQTPDIGEIKVDGKIVSINDVNAALSLGIVLIHQELNLCDNLDVASNIFLGREPISFGMIQSSRMFKEASNFLEQVGLKISPRTPLHRLTIGQQQLVEIAKALSINARVLIMDEPTSSLSHNEACKLFSVIKELKSKGVSIIYISHKLGEVEELADRAVVFRDGEKVGELIKQDIIRSKIVPMMVGRDITKIFQRTAHTKSDVVLELKNFASFDHPLNPVDFQLHAGEVVGISGLVGAGRTELLQSIFGITNKASGDITLAGKTFIVNHPSDAIKQGIALVPEDRKQHGLIIEMTVAQNTSLPSLKRDAYANVLINSRQQKLITQESIEKLAIKTPHQQQVAQFLSGGNQQKIVIGKWLAMSPKVLLLDEPTRGIDVGAKQEIYQLIDTLAKAGMAILFVSSEMDEIISLSDRVLVMHEGKVTGQLQKNDINELNLIRLATGQA